MICFCGDGGFFYHLPELETARRRSIKTVTIVNNNHCLSQGLRNLNIAYEGRKDLGNTRKGDGVRYKGRGLIQLTGRANYSAFSAYAGVDYLAQPALLASDPLVAVDAACWFWHDRGLAPLAEQDDVKAVTKRINGLSNGPHTHLDERIANLNRAKAVLGL